MGPMGGWGLVGEEQRAENGREGGGRGRSGRKEKTFPTALSTWPFFSLFPPVEGDARLCSRVSACAVHLPRNPVVIVALVAQVKRCG